MGMCIVMVVLHGANCDFCSLRHAKREELESKRDSVVTDLNLIRDEQHTLKERVKLTERMLDDFQPTKEELKGQIKKFSE
ncbi:hypothetical protein NDU88_004104 [Pleurodeles waltl]|uniref:Uncharacterized protein n=1 Tax=Pleurodeles waltl TaxID=8319 RepID=A0AAV7TT72_PLEWA|nr:hypothetical protein NDU88_004104 [Pleurodeles waltl]